MFSSLPDRALVIKPNPEVLEAFANQEVEVPQEFLDVLDEQRRKMKKLNMEHKMEPIFAKIEKDYKEQILNIRKLCLTIDEEALAKYQEK